MTSIENSAANYPKAPRPGADSFRAGPAARPVCRPSDPDLYSICYPLESLDEPRGPPGAVPRRRLVLKP